MTDQTPGSDAAKAIGDPLGTVVGWMAGLLPEGPARTLLFVVTGLSILAAPFINKYYLGLLAQGAQLEGSLERHDYDELRTGLAGDNLAARIYAKWLTGFLDWVEQQASPHFRAPRLGAFAAFSGAGVDQCTLELCQPA